MISAVLGEFARGLGVGGLPGHYSDGEVPFMEFSSWHILVVRHIRRMGSEVVGEVRCGVVPVALHLVFEVRTRCFESGFVLWVTRTAASVIRSCTAQAQVTSPFCNITYSLFIFSPISLWSLGECTSKL